MILQWLLIYIFTYFFRIMCLLPLLLLFNIGHCQTKLLMLSTNSATPERRSNPMSLMVWMCNWTLKLKVTMLVLIMKLKESCLYYYLRSHGSIFVRKINKLWELWAFLTWYWLLKFMLRSMDFFSSLTLIFWSLC